VTLLAPAPGEQTAGSHRAPGRRTLPAADLLRWVAAVASLGAAAIHFAVVGEHWQEWKPEGLFFGVLGWVQVFWAVAVLQVRSRALLLLGALGQLGVVVLWAVTRTVGLPFGPSAGEAEAASPIDIICCGLEAVAATAALLLLVRGVRRVRWSRGATLAAIGVLVAAMAGATTASLIPSVGGSEHQHADGELTTDGHTHPTAAVTGDIPAGWVAGCHTAHTGDIADIGHASGSCTDAPVTPQQRAAAERLVADTTADVAGRYPTLAAAEKAGYRVINQTGPLVHVGNPAYQHDGRVLDPTRVESLVYVSFGRTSMLLGAMYIAEPSAPQGPLIGGALTSWHVHTNLCVDDTAGTALNPRADGTCAPGSAIGPTAQMLHVWTIPYAGGPFADINSSALISAVSSEMQRRAAARPS
jgi:hypothetical protein